MSGDGIIRYGVHAPLEAAANELIRASLEGVTSMSAKSDILTPWKEQDRRRREVYAASGVPDSSIRSGLYGRSANAARPDLNSRDGIARSYRGGTSGGSFKSLGGMQNHVDQDHGGEE